MIVGQINGQYRQIAVFVLDEKMKNKKIRKKFQRTIYITWLIFSEKFFLQKSRNDSVASDAPKGGVGVIFAPIRKRLAIHAQHGRIAPIFHGFLLMIRAYNVKTAFCRFWCALLAFFCLCGIFYSAAKIRA